MELHENCTVIVNESFRSSTDSVQEPSNGVHPDVVKIRNCIEKNGKVNGTASVEELIEPVVARPTSYVETLMHVFKGNVGPGCLAMADAVKNGGLILGPILTLIIGAICVHAQHILLNCSAKMKHKHQLKVNPDYAETVELCFSSSDKKKFRDLAPVMKRICNIFICVTQLGFCCIYFLFIGTNLKQVLDFYGFQLQISVLVTIILIPIWLSAMITNLKYLGESNNARLPLKFIIQVFQRPVRVLPAFV